MAPIYREVDHDFFKIWSREMAYVLGYFAADGAMIQNNRNAHFIEFHSTDKILIDIVRGALKSTHHIGVRIPKKDKPRHKIVFRLQIGSKSIFTDLQNLGFVQNKSNSMQYPLIPARFLGDFVRGYFDGDGCVYFRQHFVKELGREKWIFTTRFTSGSRQYLSDLHTQLKLCGIEKGYIVSKKLQNGHELVFSRRDSLALYRLMYNTASVTGFYLPRKYELFQKAIRNLYPNLRV